MKTKNQKIRRILCYFVLIAALAIALNVWFVRKEARPIQQLEDAPESLIILTGKLSLKLFPGPPEYSSIDQGDRADYCWILELDQPSFFLALNTPVNELSLPSSDILKRSNANEVVLVIDENLEGFCQKYEHQKVAVKGHLFHAHTAHHYTPMLLDAKEVVGFEALIKN